MNLYEETIHKLQGLSDALLSEVRDFIDFLLSKYARDAHELVEAGMSDYLETLEEYETRLARGEVEW